MNQKIYISLVVTFCIIFITFTMVLTNRKDEADLEMWTYYSGGQNVAADHFSNETNHTIEITGVAQDNYTLKLDSAIKSNQLPDIIIVESNDLGRYLDSDQFIDFNQVFANDESYNNYLNNASEYGLNLGTYNDEQRAIKFENTSSIFVYRSDLASVCLGIESPEQMNEMTAQLEDYTRMFKQLKASEDQRCNQLSLFATSEYTNYLQNPNNIITDDSINPEVINWLDFAKTNIDTDLVYSRFGSYHELIDDSATTPFFGDVTTVNKLRGIYDFNQPGQWAVAQTPIDYQGNSPYFLVSKDADLNLVRQFFTTTYFDQDWLKKNINSLGILENEEVMNSTTITEIAIDEYFSNDNYKDEYIKAGYKTINDNQDVVSKYDYGIRNTIIGVMNDYISGNITRNEIEDRISDDLQVFYN